MSFTLAFLPVLVHGQSAAADDTALAGRVILVRGDVEAIDIRGGSRALRRGAQVFVGDTIVTSATSATQIRMVDDALIALKEATEFAIVAYQYEQDPVSDSSVIELVQGGFRTMTGAIGEQNRSAYEASVREFATIGIRGTDYEVILTELGEVVTGVYDGGTTVANAAGQLDLGIGADYDFALLSNPQTPPQGLLQQPARLGAISFAVTADDEEEEAEEEAQEETDGDQSQEPQPDDQDTDDNQPDDGDGSADNADAQDSDQQSGDNTDAAGNTQAANDDNQAPANAGDDTAAAAGTAVASNSNSNSDSGTATGLLGTQAGDTGIGTDDQSSAALNLVANDGGVNAARPQTEAAQSSNEAAVNLAPPSGVQFAETQNTVVATSTAAREPTESGALAVNPSETNGSGSVACSKASANCNALVSKLTGTAGNSAANGKNTVQAGNLSPGQISFLRALGITVGNGNGTIDISALTAAQLASLRGLESEPADTSGGIGDNSGDTADVGTTIDVDSLSGEQIEFLRGLGLAQNADNGTIDISGLTESQLESLKSLTGDSGNGSSDSDVVTVAVSDLSGDQISFLRNLGLSVENGAIDITKLSADELSRLQALVDDNAGGDPADPSDQTDPTTPTDIATVAITDLSSEQIDFLNTLGLVEDNGVVDISRLSKDEVARLNALASGGGSSNPADPATPNNGVTIKASSLSSQQAEFLRSLGVSVADGVINLSKLSDDQLARLKELGSDTTGTGAGNDSTTIDAGLLTDSQIEFLRSLGLSQENGVIDISKLSDDQISQLKELSGGDLSGGVGDPGDGVNPVPANGFSDEQLSFLRSLGLTQDENGFIDVSKLSEEELKQLASLEANTGNNAGGGSTGTGNGNGNGAGNDNSGANTVLIDISGLTERQIEYLGSLGLTPDKEKGTIDIGSLSNNELRQLEELANTTGGNGNSGNQTSTDNSVFINVSGLTEKQIEFLSSQGFSVSNGRVDIGGLSDDQRREFEELANHSDTTHTDSPTDSSGAGNTDSGNGGSGNGNSGTDNSSDDSSSGNGNAGNGNTGNGNAGNGNAGNGNAANDSSAETKVTIDASNLTQAQLDFLRDLGRTPENGVVDVTGLSDAQLDQLKTLVDSGGAASPGEFIQVSNLNDEQKDFLKSLGLEPVDGVVDISSLSAADKTRLLAMVATLLAAPKTIETADIAWGKWDNPLDSNWVVVQNVDDQLVRISTQDYFAEVNRASIADMSGSYSYQSGVASSFIGSGTGGDVSSLVAGMEVNFDTGVISNGSLQVMAGDQSWAVGFEGLIQGGELDFISKGGHLMDSSGLLSNTIEADIGGAFTGNEAEAFVGGFDLLDAINPINTVNGIFTIER